MMKFQPPCLEWRERLALRREELSFADQQALDAHIHTCEACAVTQADYLFFEARLDALPSPAIKPLPRLSPHFFTDTDQDLEEHAPQDTSKVQRRSNLILPERSQQKSKKASFFGRFLAIAIVTTLIVAAGALFGNFYLANQATHLAGGNTLCSLRQQTDAITAVAWSPNGKYIATASQDHTVIVWNAQSCKPLHTYLGHDAIVYALTWSPDSAEIASASLDFTVQVWNALSGDSVPLVKYTGHHSPVFAVAWSPDGKYIASGGEDDTVQVWTASTGKWLWSYYNPNQTEPIDALAWSPDSNQLATGSWNALVQILNVQTRTLSYTYTGHSNTVTSVAWSPNTNYIASASSDGTVQVWSTTPATIGQRVQTYTKHISNVNTVAWSPDGKYIASGGLDDTVQVWNAFTGTTIKIYSDHTSRINSIAWDPDPPTKHSDEIVSGSDDHSANVWTVAGI